MRAAQTLTKLTWSPLMVIVVCGSVVSVSAGRRGLGASVWSSLRSFATRLHLMTPRCPGPRPSRRRAARWDVQLLDPVQREIPQLRVICR